MKERKVEEVYVKVDHQLVGRSQQAVTQGQTVVRGRDRAGLDLREHACETLGDSPGGVLGAVLDDDDLEPPPFLAKTGHDGLDRRFEERLLLVSREHH